MGRRAIPASKPMLGTLIAKGGLGDKEADSANISSRIRSRTVVRRLTNAFKGFRQEPGVITGAGIGAVALAHHIAT